MMEPDVESSSNLGIVYSRECTDSSPFQASNSDRTVLRGIVRAVRERCSAPSLAPTTSDRRMELESV